MKRVFSIISLILVLCCAVSVFSACPSTDDPNGGQNGDQNGGDNQNNNGEVLSMKITIGNKQFTATLYDTAAAQAFAKLLPLTLDMSELNGNEKYNYLSTTLPTKTENVGQINAGDIMLYGNSCIVLFYKSFSTAYSYTKIGKIDNVTGLQQAVGSGSVTVTFQAK